MGARLGRAWRQPVGLPLMEWSLMLGLLLLVAGWFTVQVRQVQGQAELASVVGTVGSMRTALALDQIQRAAQGKEITAAQAVRRNPFTLLGRVPYNYRGEMDTAEAYRQVPGSWVYSPECGCVGYLPMGPSWGTAWGGGWLQSPLDDAMLWLQVSAPPDTQLLRFRERYRWQGQPVEIGERN